MRARPGPSAVVSAHVKHHNVWVAPPHPPSLPYHTMDVSMCPRDWRGRTHTRPTAASVVEWSA